MKHQKASLSFILKLLNRKIITCEMKKIIFRKIYIPDQNTKHCQFRGKQPRAFNNIFSRMSYCPKKVIPAIKNLDVRIIL